MRGIKSMQVYSWKHMECTSGLARFIEFSYSDKHAICLNSRIRELEGSVAQTIVCRGRRGNCPALQHAGLSMLCNMLGERSRTSLHLMIFFLKEIPSTLQRRAWFHSSNHTTLGNYLDSMGSLWENMFTRTWKNARNKEYANLFMNAYVVHKVMGRVHWV